MRNITNLIGEKIYFIRNHKVMLDSDLALLYDVSSKRLNEQVKRNRIRFPEDFMFQLTAAEYDFLRSQFATSKNQGGRRYLPYVFTEQGVAMLSTVLHSEKAILVNIEIMRTFVNLRKILSENKDMLKRLDDLEKRYDAQFRAVFDAIRQLMTPSLPVSRRKIGFKK